MRLGRMWNGESRSANRLEAPTDADCNGGPSPGRRQARGYVIVAIVECSARLPACLGTRALRASACGLPIRPVLKHGPRSLTCVRVNGRVKPVRRKEANWRDPLCGLHRRPTLISCEGFE